MRSRFSCSVVFWCLLLSATVFLSSTHPAQAQIEWVDWPRYEALEKSLSEVKKSNPAQAIEQYRAFWNQNPRMHPISGCMTFASLALVQRDQMKQPAEALKTYEQGLQVYTESSAVVILLKDKAETLRQLKRYEEAGALGEEWWPKMREAARSGHAQLQLMAGLSLYQIVLSLEEQTPGMADKSAERGEPGERDEQAGVVWKAEEMTSHPARAQWVALLQRALCEAPFFLDDRRQGANDNWFAGWMYRHLIIGLLAEGRAEEALSWGRLYWSLSRFEEGALKDASRLLGRAWMSLGKSKEILAFVQAQGKEAQAMSANPLAANPLFKMKMPPLSEEAREYLQTRWQSKVQELTKAQSDGKEVAFSSDTEFINLGLWQSLSAHNEKERNQALEQTMLVAEARFKGLLQTKPEDKNIGREVARVLKAADGNTLRAQAFMNYVGGKGDNPLTGFYQQVRGGDVTGEVVAVEVASNEVSDATPKPATKSASKTQREAAEVRQ